MSKPANIAKRPKKADDALESQGNLSNYGKMRRIMALSTRRHPHSQQRRAYRTDASGYFIRSA